MMQLVLWKSTNMSVKRKIIPFKHVHEYSVHIGCALGVQNGPYNECNCPVTVSPED